MATRIILKEYECSQCGRWFYIHENVGNILGVRCPFFCIRGEGVFIRYIRVLK